MQNMQYKVLSNINDMKIRNMQYLCNMRQRSTFCNRN